jgi:cytochrome c peroxidase
MKAWVVAGTVAGLAVCAAAPAPSADDMLRLPLGLPRESVSIPADNPLTADKIAFGKQLFWDKRWSFSGTVACVSCHLPHHGWSDPLALSVHASGKPTARRSPVIINRLFSNRQGWGGLRASLEDLSKNDSNRRDDLIVKNLGAIQAYQEQHRKVFGTDLNTDGVARAIAAYTRTILSGNSPYDRFQAGDTNAMSPAARRGLALHEGKARCSRCHSGFNFTDEGYHNLGVGMDRENPDLGRYIVTKREVNKGAFKTPTLRDVAQRPPYMHDGSIPTLREVVAFYNRGGATNPWLSPDIAPLNLTREEQDDLVAFLEALSGEVSADVATPPVLPP